MSVREGGFLAERHLGGKGMAVRRPMQRAPQADAAHSVGHRSVLRRVGKGAVVGKLVKWLLPATKLPRKSIQEYFAIYPRINGQVSKDTLPSKLASVFPRFYWFFCNLVEKDSFL